MGNTREEIAAQIQFLFQHKIPPSWSDDMKNIRLKQADDLIKKVAVLAFAEKIKEGEELAIVTHDLQKYYIQEVLNESR